MWGDADAKPGDRRRHSHTGGALEAGNLVACRIIAAGDYDLFAEIT